MSTPWQGNSSGQQYDKDGLPVNNTGAGANNYYAAFEQSQQPSHPAYDQPQAGQPHVGQVQPYNQYQQPMVQPKSKIAAALLFFFLGEMGIGNFYLGQNNLGIIKLVLFLVGVFTFIFIIGAVILGALWIWKMVEFVMVLTGGGGYDRDARGIPLR